MSTPTGAKPKGGSRKAAAAAAVQGAQAGGAAGGAAGYIAKRREQRADLKTRQKQARAAGADRERIRQASESGRKSAQPFGRALAKFPRKMLLGELVVCLVIVWGGALVAPQGSNNGTTRAMVKTSGLAAVFLVLALVSAGGKGAQKTASAFGALVTLAYAFTSSDALELAKWVGQFWSRAGVGGTGGMTADAGAEVEAALPKPHRYGQMDASSTPDRPVYV